MKMKILFLLLIAAPLILASCGGNSFEFLAKDDSDEACRYQTAKDLDAGDYDAVLGSTCADDMQKGAAYFGKAGYDIVDIIKSFVDAGSTENSNASNQSSDLDMFMSSSVTGVVTSDSLTNLKKADGHYKIVAGSDEFDAEQKKDAEFYSGIVNAFRSLSLMKTIIDFDGSGTLSTCDINNNQTPDDVDAVSCALYTAVSQSCAGVKTSVIATVTPLNVPDTDTANGYKGVVIQADNLGGPGSTDAACTGATYRKLILGTTLVTTSSTTCTGSDGGLWPCPIMNENDQPLSLVTAVQESLTTAADSIAASIGADSGDVAKAIDEINSGACGIDKVCTEAEIAQYLQNL